MKRLLSVIVAALLCLGPAIAQDAQPTTDELDSFRAAYTSGTGLAYVVVKDDQARPCTATAMRRVRQRNETSAALCYAVHLRIASSFHYARPARRAVA